MAVNITLSEEQQKKFEAAFIEASGKSRFDRRSSLGVWMCRQYGIDIILTSNFEMTLTFEDDAKGVAFKLKHL